ncbi:MAG: hypothetical protein PHO63_04840 [Bacilli bacterium]|nr:hypothetical protein [Bacilli bacterium]MDD4808798.1 hypothetical protein [Bacilli bacterium]
MKKNVLFLCLFAFGLLFVGAQQVNATCSGGLQAPQIAQVVATNKGLTTSLTTTASACKGSNTAVWFSNFGTLPNWYQPSSGTIVHGHLWEDDPVGNPDERVKYYIGWFEGRVLTDFWLQETYITGNIDSEGDQTCELYMTFFISGTYGDPPIPQGLFYYNQCMN